MCSSPKKTYKRYVVMTTSREKRKFSHFPVMSSRTTSSPSPKMMISSSSHSVMITCSYFVTLYLLCPYDYAEGISSHRTSSVLNHELPNPLPAVIQELSSTSDTPLIILEKGLNNITKPVGSSVTLKCQFRYDGPLIFAWYQNNAPLEEREGKFEVRNSRTKSGDHITKLKISKLDPLDTAFYKCEAISGQLSEESTGILKVDMSNADSSSVIESAHPPILPDFEDPTIEIPGGYSPT